MSTGAKCRDIVHAWDYPIEMKYDLWLTADINAELSKDRYIHFRL